MRGLALLGLVLAIAGLPASSASAAAPSGPLLTYAVAYLVDQVGGEGGLCATDPAGHAFRVSDPQDDAEPAWSPDGRLIAFEREATRDPMAPGNIFDIFVTDAQGRHRRNVTRFGGGNLNYGPSWSPNGTKLAFFGAWYGGGIRIVNVDGTGATEVVGVGYPGSIGSPSWSPDGQRLLYGSVRGAHPSAVYVVDIDGKNETKLIDSAASPVWSPDGEHIAYLAVQGQEASVAVANADGSNQRLLTSAAESLFGRLDWSPDGSWIGFSRHPGASFQLMLIRPDGSDEHPAPTGGLQAYDPAWRPAGALPTHRRPCLVRGTSKNDVLVGTDRGDLMVGGKGNDLLRGRGGDDVLVGGSGHDRLEGGRGDDVFVTADEARDYVFGGPGKDSAVIDHADRLGSIEYRYH